MSAILNFLNGKKTIIGATGYVLTAIGGLILHYTHPEDTQAMTAVTASVIFFKGFLAVGFADKLRKIFAEVKKFLDSVSK